MIDTHAHLDACQEPATVLVERAVRAGIERVVTIGTGIDSCRAALAIADASGGRVVAALGVDPHSAGGPDARRLDELRELLARPGVVAVGETGLDNHHHHATPSQQRELFEAQLQVAAESGLPVVVHCREAADETASALSSFRGTVVLHCFSEPGLFPAALENGWYVSFAGNVTYPRADALRAVARDVPADRLLVETDSPYLAPQPVRGRPNEPAHLVHTLALLADVRGEDSRHLAELTAANAAAAFAI